MVTPRSHSRLSPLVREAARLAGWSPVNPDLACVLAERHIADIVQAILDLPVATPQLLQADAIRLLR